MAKYDKNSIDREAEAEANALSKMDKKEKPKRLRFETGYNEAEFDKLFIDKLHRDEEEDNAKFISDFEKKYNI